MSRIGKQPIPIPSGVEVQIAENNQVKIKGPKGELEQSFNPGMVLKLADNQLTVERPDDSKFFCALHGLTRALLANMVQGVNVGFKKTLEINGVGYRANLEEKKLRLQLGYSHLIYFPIPEGLKIEVQKQTVINIEGIDKQLVGQAAADIRAFRPPEPYKGKGIKYANEVIRRKAGKTGA